MDRVTDQPKVRYAALLLAASFAVVLMVCWVGRHFFTVLGHDQVSYLVEAQTFLGGNEIYGPHLSETNPPVIIWFSTLPVLLAQHLSGSSMFWFRVIVLLLMGVSTAWCVRILQRGGKFTSGMTIGLYGFSVLMVCLSSGYYEMGQRENLFLILVVPYLLAVATGAVARLSPLERGLLGVAAGCAIWFKPQDVLVVVALELVCALWARTLRRVISVEFIAMVLTSGLILGLVLLFTPLYVHQVVPLLGDVYWGIAERSFSALMVLMPSYYKTIPLAFLAYFLLRKRLTDRLTPFAFLVCSLGAYVAYGIQHTTWQYHQYPHRALYLLALCYVGLDLLDPYLSKVELSSIFPDKTALAVSWAAVVLVLVFTLNPELRRKDQQIAVYPPLTAFLDQVKPGSTVSVLSTGVSPLAQVYAHNLKWGSRFAHLWMLPAIIQNEMGPNSPDAPFKQLSPETTARLADLQRQEVVEDLNYWHPDLVLIPICSHEKPCFSLGKKELDMLAWFKKSPDFLNAWSRYDQQLGFEGYDVYRLAR